MADQSTNPNLAALRKLEASLQSHFRECERRAAKGDWLAMQLACLLSLLHRLPSLQTSLASVRLGLAQVSSRLRLRDRWPRFRRYVYAAGLGGAVVLLVLIGFWWRLASGPIELDLVTPWLTAAIEENFGSSHHVEVGGTQLERDANGRTALRMRDIVVRDADGTVVASAPKAEVGVSGTGLFTGRIRAERLSLVGAEMAVRIEPDSRITVFAGANKRPFVTASATPAPLRAGMTTGTIPSGGSEVLDRAPAAAPNVFSSVPDFSALLAWIDGLGATGLDGRDLSELGLKNGNLVVDDQRNGKQWTFQDIDLSLTRPKGGGIALTLSSDSAEPPWSLRAVLKPGEHGHRLVDLETQKLPARDLMLAMRVGDGFYEPNLPLSVRVRAELGPDGLPQMIDGRVVVEKGTLVDVEEPFTRIAIDRAEFSLDWDAMRQALMIPFQVVSGSNRITLLAELEAPRGGVRTWGMKLTGGTVVLASAPTDANPLILNRFLMQLRLDPDKQRIDVEQGEIGNLNVRLAISGSLDYSTGDPRLRLGVAGNRMSVDAMKKIWPFCVTPKVRAWAEEHILSGTVERLVIATNAPLSTLKASGPPVPDDGLSIEIVGSGTEIRPVEGLPSIRDADINVKISGRVATINLGRGNVELSPGRKLSIVSGAFEVPDTFPHAPPAKVRFRLDGPVPAAAELLALDRLRDFSGSPVDPATSRGTITAQVQLGLPLKEDLPPGSAVYNINMDIANFVAEHLVMGQKVEATSLKVSANNQGYWIHGDAKLNGVPAALDYRKPRGEGDAEVRVQATLDESARGKLGFDLGPYVSGAVPIKLAGHVPAVEGEARYAVEADLTQAKVENLLPGWTKPYGKPTRLAFTLINGPLGPRFEEVVIDGSGASVKGTVELDDTGEVLSANFPVFSLSEGDKSTLKAERGTDGALRVTMRGDLYDGRGFVKSALAGPSNGQNQEQAKDVDLDIKLGTVAGFHGETLRGLDLKLSRRGGTVKSFALNAKLGRDTPLIGDLRGRSAGRQVIYLETKDAGSFFRFTDIYPKVTGGEMWVAMDPPAADAMPQQGTLNVRDFSVRGEASLERVASGAPSNPRPGVEFSHMRVDFTKSLGRFAIREGVVRGPVIGATVDGYIDYLKDEVRMRGTFVPLYGLNNMFGQIPLFGIFLGGEKEGLVGVTYEVIGPPGAPILRVNPISAVAPGLLRKFFEFPSSTTGSTPQSYANPRGQ